VVEVVELLLCKHEALSLNPSPIEKQRYYSIFTGKEIGYIGRVRNISTFFDKPDFKSLLKTENRRVNRFCLGVGTSGKVGVGGGHKEKEIECSRNIMYSCNGKIRLVETISRMGGR
jgi:hypothetical protein